MLTWFSVMQYRVYLFAGAEHIEIHFFQIKTKFFGNNLLQKTRKDFFLGIIKLHNRVTERSDSLTQTYSASGKNSKILKTRFPVFTESWSFYSADLLKMRTILKLFFNKSEHASIF